MTHMIPQPQQRPQDLAWQSGSQVASGVAIDMDDLPGPSAGMSPLQVALRRKWLVLGFAALVAAGVGVGVRQLSPRYTSAASVVVDARQPRVSGGESLLPTQTLDFDLLRTRMEAARDPALATEVVQQLNLQQNPDYCMQRIGLAQRTVDTVARLLPPGTVPADWVTPPSAAMSCPSSVKKAAERLLPTVSVNNDARSYVIRISADASSPELASAIANAYAAVFVTRQRETGVGLTSQSEAWLSSHLAELRAAVVAADADVTRAQDSSQVTLQRGETVVAQRLAELNSQLTAATGELQQKRALLRTVQSGGAADASVTALSSPIVQRLIDRQGQLSANLADLQTRLGAGHPQVQAAAAQLGQVNGQLRSEVGKSVSGLRGEVDGLETRRASLATEVETLQRQVTNQGPASMRMRDLQRDADSARKQYDAAVARLEQIRADAATQRSDVQMLVQATPPEVPSFPRSNMITAGAFLASLGFAGAAAFAIEMMSRVFTTPEQVEGDTGLRVLGLFPKPRRRRMKPENVVVAQPTSRDAEATHAILVNLLGRGFNPDAPAARVVMVTSAIPGEGKTSFSLALGRVARRSGLSVAIVDCDLRRSGLRTMVGPLDVTPVGDLALPNETAQIVTDTASGLTLVRLRIGQSQAQPHSVANRELRAVLEVLRSRNDLIIVDTPPVLAVPDALSMGALADETVLLTAWRSTRRKDSQTALKMLRRARVHVSGVVLSKVDLRQMAKRPSHGFYATAYPAYEGPA